MKPHKFEVSTNADLSGVNLTGVNLTGVNLSRANLSGANLSYADLSRVRSTGIQGTPKALPDGWILKDGCLVADPD